MTKPQALRLAFSIGLTVALMGCTSATRTVSTTKDVYGAVGRPRPAGNANLIIGPGYAPAYPPFDAPSYQPAD